MSSGLQVEGRVALVTGANRGIGRALVDALLERGARKVYATARKPETLSEFVASSDGRAVALRLDITNAAEVDRAAAQADDVDLLINNAACGQPRVRRVRGCRLARCGPPGVRDQCAGDAACLPGIRSGVGRAWRWDDRKHQSR